MQGSKIMGSGFRVQGWKSLGLKIMGSRFRG